MTQVVQGCRCRELHNHAKEEAELRVVHSAKVRRTRRPCIIIADDAQQATDLQAPAPCKRHKVSSPTTDSYLQHSLPGQEQAQQGHHTAISQQSQPPKHSSTHAYADTNFSILLSNHVPYHHAAQGCPLRPRAAPYLKLSFRPQLRRLSTLIAQAQCLPHSCNRD